MSNAVVVHWKDHHDNICGRLYEKFVQEKHTDVTVRCGDASRKAHSVVLAANSNYLEDTLAKDCKEIVFPDMSEDTLEKFFEFLYLGATILEESELDSFLAAGRMLEINGLPEADQETESESNDKRFIINSKEDFRSLLQKVDSAAQNTSDIVLDQTQMAIQKVAKGSRLAVERLRRCLMLDDPEDCDEENGLNEDNMAAQMLTEELKKEDELSADKKSGKGKTRSYKKTNLQENMQLLVVEDDNNQFWVENSENNECYLLNSSEDISARYISDSAREIGSDESTQEASEVDCPPSDSENDGFLN